MTASAADYDARLDITGEAGDQNLTLKRESQFNAAAYASPSGHQGTPLRAELGGG